jgi:hypothetical protein
MPQPSKPDILKLISGSREPLTGTLADIPVLEEVPLPPDWLPNAHARKEWERLAPLLVANRLLTDAAISTLGVLCALHGKIVQLFSADMVPTAHLIAQYRNLCNDFGIPPVAAGKVRSNPQAKPTPNKFAANGRRPS